MVININKHCMYYPQFVFNKYWAFGKQLILAKLAVCINLDGWLSQTS